MTHNIPSEDGNSSTEQFKKEQSTPEEAKNKLLQQLNKHLEQVSKYVDETHSQKMNVLAAAIDVLEGRKTREHLSIIITKSPKYKQAFWQSETERLVSQVNKIDETSRAQTPQDQTPQDQTSSPLKQALLSQIEQQLNLVKDKTNDLKFVHKHKVLTAAVAYLRDPTDESRQALETAKNSNPRYKEALFSSKTEHLINQTFKVVGLEKENRNAPSQPMG